MRPPISVAAASEIHDRIIEATGGASGVRDSNALASALAAPFQSFGAADVYPGLVPKAAALTRGIVRGHPFVDGNKRTAFVLLVTFLRLHRRRLVASDTEIEDTLVAVEHVLFSGNQPPWQPSLSTVTCTMSTLRALYAIGFVESGVDRSRPV